MKDHNVSHQGKHLEFRKSNRGWEYFVRPGIKGCVAVLAITQDKQIILNEQFRPPVDCQVIELPAGLAGDIPLQEDEPLESAARRELKEETGYVAKHWEPLVEGPSSAGMTDEFITIFFASELTRVSDGGGTRNENIKVHHVDLVDINSWCEDRRAEGMMVDFKIFAALHYWKSRNNGSEGRLWY